MIIAQKAKTNDEIAKDLVQANQMIVTFGNQYDLKAKEVKRWFCIRRCPVLNRFNF